MWLRNLWETLGTIGLADVLDMAIMACLLYLVLVWFKKTRAAFVARGILIFAALYIVAQQAGMYLTTRIFQGFFAIFLIALVVIFQEELRSFFEKLAVWSLHRRRSSRPLPPEEVEILVRTLGLLAHAHTGAIIVLKGRDPLRRHIEGGEILDGKLSATLLASIFEPASPGHDGAVIVDGDRVVEFGVHLPLSKDFAQLGGLGTRHSAALGLAEKTDALCLVVSEERGVVTIAQDGHIWTVQDLKALEEHILSFLRFKAPVKDESPHRQFLRLRMKKNASEKALAVTISFALWLVFVQDFSPSSEIFKVPVETRAVPAELRVESIRPDKVEVTLRGLKRDLKLLNPASLKVLVDLESAVSGTQRVQLSEDNLESPRALQFARIDPRIIELELRNVRPSD